MLTPTRSSADLHVPGCPRRSPAALSLLELLVVLGVIGVLALLGLFHWQSAQARSKVARVHTDMRVLAAALESYRLDHEAYLPAAVGDLRLDFPLSPLTSPVAYLSSIPRDPFGLAPFDFNPGIRMRGYNYVDRVSTSVGMPGETYGHIWRELPDCEYCLHSCGPNHVWDILPYVEYDPTNGTVSRGDISRFGPL